MMKATIFLSTALFTLTLSAQAQYEEKNLVKNSGFEAMKGKLKKSKQINLATDWISPTGLNADLYSVSMKDGEAAASNNPYGKEEPAEGENFAGVVMFSYGDKAPRTYLQTELLGPLKSGMEYCIRFDVSLADNSKYAVNNIGANVSKRALATEEKKSLLIETHVMNSKNKIFNATYGWETICGTFTAEGGEQFLTIGNFSPTKDTRQEKVLKQKGNNATQLPVAYYYIDNVFVFPLDSVQECMCEKLTGAENPDIIYDEGFASNKEFTLEEKVAHEKIFFDNLSTTIGDININAINSLVKIMTENPDIIVEVHAYTDKSEVAAAEKDEKYIDLAKQRGEAVIKHLEKAGISKGRLLLVVEDDKNPASEGTSDIDKAKNRRVEFRIRK